MYGIISRARKKSWWCHPLPTARGMIWPLWNSLVLCHWSWRYGWLYIHRRWPNPITWVWANSYPHKQKRFPLQVQNHTDTQTHMHIHTDTQHKHTNTHKYTHTYIHTHMHSTCTWLFIVVNFLHLGSRSHLLFAPMHPWCLWQLFASVRMTIAALGIRS